MKIIFRILLILSLSFLVACDNDSSEIDEIKSVFIRNAEGMQSENLSQVLQTLDEPLRENNKTICQYLFTYYDIKYDYDILNVKLIDDTTAEVLVNQTTTKIKGPDFKNNKGKFKQLLKKKNGKWFISSTIIEQIEYL